MNQKSENVEGYIAQFSPEIQEKLSVVRAIILTNVPDAVESISYGMPAYKLNKKPLIYFASFEKHLGLYATPAAHTQFKESLLSYKQGKGSVQFPFNRPLPTDLIAEMVRFNRDTILAKQP